MKKLIWAELSEAKRAEALSRPELIEDGELAGVVRKIIERVKVGGDKALLEVAASLGDVVPDEIVVGVSELEVTAAGLSASEKTAIDVSLANIEKFHLAQRLEPAIVETMPGVVCEQRSEPIRSVGLYVPGGTAPLVSTAMMLAKPAEIAGCERVVIATPAPVSPAVAYIAIACGAEAVIQFGGAQAIAALAFGTESVESVDKIFGPGNKFVTEAKQQVARSGVAIDMPAGPTEVMVIADGNADPRFVASDLLAQCEHGVDSQAILVADSVELASRVDESVADQLVKMSRIAVAEKSLSYSLSIVVDNLATAFDVSAQYCPEHLILQVDEPRQWLKSVRGAGSVFVGPWSPEAVGDYSSGTNHVLPTSGWARTTSALSLSDFQRTYTVQELTFEGLVNLSESVQELALLEGLDGHARSVSVRLENV